MVCLSSRGPNSEMLLRYASRLAGKFNRNWYAIYVQTPSEAPTVIDAHTQRILSGTLTLAKQLGAMVFTYKGRTSRTPSSVFARNTGSGHRRGSPTPLPPGSAGRGAQHGGRLIHDARGMTVVVLDTREEERRTRGRLRRGGKARASRANHRTNNGSSRFQAAGPEHPDPTRGIVIWNQPVRKEIALRTLVDAASGARDRRSGDDSRVGPEAGGGGSTFFNEGVAFPTRALRIWRIPSSPWGSPARGWRTPLSKSRWSTSSWCSRPRSLRTFRSGSWGSSRGSPETGTSS